MAYSIETNCLSKEFIRCGKADSVINNINLKVKDAELFGLIGPNGAGKTTFIKILCCLILPTNGSAKVAGLSILEEENKVKASIGLVNGDERSFYWRLTGRQNLHFFASLYNIPSDQAKRRIEELLDYLEIKEADKRFQEYSAGIKQRLSIARSLLNNPSVIFMDEPTKSLDPNTAGNLRKFIKKKLAGEQRKTVFFATHNLKEADELADRLAIMHKGEIKAIGTFNEFRRQTANPDSSIEEIFSRFTKEKTNDNVS